MDAVCSSRPARAHARRMMRNHRSPGLLQAIFLGSACSWCAPAFSGPPTPVRSRSFDIEYSVNDDAQPLDRVRLWYTPDGGKTWLEYGTDEDRQSPFAFDAPREGRIGFFLIAYNSAGPSSMPPRTGTRPQFEAYIDYRPPIVQLYPLRQSTALGQRILQIRWTAVDAHFGPRPVELEYQGSGDEAWTPISAEPLANTGLYDWRVPDAVTGTVAVHVTVTDRGGHRVVSERQVVELRPAGSTTGSESLAGWRDPAAGDRRLSPSDSTAVSRIERLYREAVNFRDRGRYRDGISRLREVVRLDPARADAFADMADMLYRVGNTERALSAYQLALRQAPTMRSALRGAAMIHRRNNNHAAAAGLLRRVLRHNPNDAEVWMNLGDVAIYQGDEVLARECYTRATQINPNDTGVIADARKRLDLMDGVSRRFGGNNNR